MNFFQPGALLYADKQSRIPLLISLTLIAITTTVTVIYISFAQPVLPILYTLTRPEESLIVKWWLLLLPAFSLLFGLIAHVLHLTLQTLDRFVLQLFSWFTIFVQLVILLALIRIIGITI